ncbi:hypothetical protein Sjap_006604 [Stephania japonica]|uniref:FAF domain-containing protein n=1 Tax=Stephania japonica TaxID=461633 RepID=A0AAP0K648_9MAGN
MSSAVFQDPNLHSTNEPSKSDQIINCATNVITCSVTKALAIEKKQSYHRERCNTKDGNSKLGGWSLVQSLTKEDNEKHYVHPLAKSPSSSKLSEKSLELCTENLGCETGNGSISSLSTSSDSEGSPKEIARERSKSRKVLHKKVSSRSFPPPLSSISNADNIHFRPHREGGRLVIKVVTIPPSQTRFQAERTDGRLRLRYNMNSQIPCKEDENEVEVGANDGGLDEEINGKNGSDGDELGIEKFHQRPCRCKDGGSRHKRMLSLDSLWVVS